MVCYVKYGQSSIFRHIKFVEDECQVSQIRSDNRNKKITKIVKKMKKKNINQVVLSKEIKQNQDFVETLENQDITIFDGKWLMQYMVQNIIIYLKEKNRISDIDEISILVNDLTDEVRENIRRMASIYKKVRIVTNHLGKFQRIEEELYEKYGIPIIITNNKRKALAKSLLIINFDFVQEGINQYNINENALIINLNDKIKINKKRFSGSIITDYELKFKNIDKKDEIELGEFDDILTKQEEFSPKEIIEEKIYSYLQKRHSYNAFSIIEEIIKKYKIEIETLFATNSQIT